MTRINRGVVFVAIASLVLPGGLCACWAMLHQGAIIACAPIIVTGEIVHIDVATGQTRERESLRYLDQAHIRIDAVHKNVLSDVKLAPKGTIGAWMHSQDPTVPDSEVNGQKLQVCVSTDLRYPVGTKGVWHIFLDKNGRFVINRHPQQRGELDGKVALGGRIETVEVSKAGSARPGMTSERWAREDRSELYPKREAKGEPATAKAKGPGN